MFESKYAGLVTFDYEKQVTTITEAVALAPKDAFILTVAGSVLTQRYSTQAFKYLKKALSITTEFAPTHTAMGYYYNFINDYIKSMQYHNRALSLKPDSISAIQGITYTLIKMKSFIEAQKYINNAIKINPNHYRLYIKLGHIAFQQQNYKEALTCFIKSIEINPHSHTSYRLMAECYLNQNMIEEARSAFQSAYKLNNNDHDTLLKWSILEYSADNYGESLEKAKLAYKIAPHQKRIVEQLQFICQYMDININSVIKEITKKSTSNISLGLPDIYALVEKIRDKYEPSIKDFVDKKKKAQERLLKFLNVDSRFNKNESIFLVLRKWNSYTPIIPAHENERCIGGGYFIYHNGKGTVIDPGYNFIENFYLAGGRIADIDNIIITHAHNDHTNDFESLMALFYQFNNVNKLKLGDENFKKIKLYLNTGSFQKFSGLLDLRGCDYFDFIYPMSPGDKYTIEGGIRITALPAFHDELVAKKYALGIHLAIDAGGETKNILLTSDTGLFPQMKTEDGFIADTSKNEIHSYYGSLKNNVNLLIPHLGSIKEEEITEPMTGDKNKIFYPNHLGIIGTARIITAIKPKLAIISEFGEELKAFRKELIDLLVEVVDGYFKSSKEHKPKILPGDISFIYNIATESIYCILSESLINYKDINYELIENDFYFFDKNLPESKDTDMLKDSKKIFEARRSSGDAAYLQKKVKRKT